MTRRPGGSDGPEDVDAAFAEIVASLEAEGLGALFDEHNLGRDEFGKDEPGRDGIGRELTSAEPTGPTGGWGPLACGCARSTAGGRRQRSKS